MTEKQVWPGQCLKCRWPQNREYDDFYRHCESPKCKTEAVAGEVQALCQAKKGCGGRVPAAFVNQYTCVCQECMGTAV